MSSTPASAHLPPVFLLAGGHWRRGKLADPLLHRILAGRFARPPAVAYLGAASGDDPQFFHGIETWLRSGGTGRVRLAPTADPRANESETRRILNGADIVFVSGGDVEAGMRLLAERHLTPFLRHLHKSGKLFVGISAGSIMLCRSWVRWRDPADDDTAESFECLGLAPIVCDTHAEGDDWVELRALLRLNPEGVTGYGIPTGGGLEVTADGTLRELGHGVTRIERTATGLAVLPTGSVRP
jgi:peptidase E